MSIAQTIINKQQKEQLQKLIVQKVKKFCKANGVSLSQFLEEYNRVYNKPSTELKYSSFYYKINNLTFTDKQLHNLEFIVGKIEQDLNKHKLYVATAK